MRSLLINKKINILDILTKMPSRLFGIIIKKHVKQYFKLIVRKRIIKLVNMNINFNNNDLYEIQYVIIFFFKQKIKKINYYYYSKIKDMETQNVSLRETLT